jgi:hypothetical protein
MPEGMYHRHLAAVSSVVVRFMERTTTEQRPKKYRTTTEQMSLMVVSCLIPALNQETLVRLSNFCLER